MRSKIRRKLYDIIFEADTFTGKLFDVLLLIVIVISIFMVMLESVAEIEMKYGHILRLAEWIITGIFTVEYIIRIYVVNKPLKYITSFYGIVDLLAILPTVIAFFIAGTGGLAVIRGLRLIRIFRILKLSRYTNEGRIIVNALIESRQKLSVFLVGVITIVVFIGAVMYIVEGPENGFTSIPESIYWAVVTITTVGYGEIVPFTAFGKFIATVLMIMGYAIIAVPTGIVTVELTKKKRITTQVCPNCLCESHDYDAVYCKRCSHILNEE